MTAPILLDTADLAARLGVKPGTVRTYLARGVLPTPDERVGRTPRWRLSTIQRWERGRPGQGGRTDLRPLHATFDVRSALRQMDRIDQALLQARDA